MLINDTSLGSRAPYRFVSCTQCQCACEALKALSRPFLWIASFMA